MSEKLISRGFSLDRLNTFRRVVEAGSIAVAADHDPNRQSQYSRQIRQLEESLQRTLFEREGRSMNLNSNGRQLALIANSFFASMDEFAFGTTASTIRIGAGDSATETFFYPRFAAVRKTFPGVRFDMMGMSTRDIAKSLSNGSIEFGILREDAEIREAQITPLGGVRFDLVVPRSLLPTGTIGALETIEELPLATLTGEGRFVRSLPTISQEIGVRFRIVAEADSFSKIVSLAKSGTLAAILPVGMAESLPNDQFARAHPDALDSLNRSLVLAVSSKAADLRPTLSRTFEQLGRILAG